MERQLQISNALIIEGWMSVRELSFLSTLCSELEDNSVIFEIGSYIGKSARAMADNSPDSSKIYCIDPWDYEIYTTNQGKVIINDTTYYQFRCNLQDHIQSGKVIPSRMKWEEFSPGFMKANFIFIDGDHDYENVRCDIEKALDYSNPDSCIIAGHDYDWPEVRRAVIYMFGENKVFIDGTIWWTRISGTPSKREKQMESKVLVALVTGEYVRQASFIPSFLNLERPTNSFTSTVHGQSPAAGRNMIIKQGLEHNCSHIFFMDDDMVFPPDTLMKLLAHDKPIVSALYLLRAFPHRPAFFDTAYDDGKCKFASLKKELKGLVKGVNAGLGAVLIKSEVFKKLEPPYVRLGEIDKDGWCDDVGFFNRCRAAGYDIWCDLNAPVGHMTYMTIWPEIHEDEWYTNYKHTNGNVRISQNIPTLEEIKAQELDLGVKELVIK